jgi:hypothetical protein
MLLALMSILAREEDRSQGRRPRRRLPSLLEAGWCLEDRVLPSAAGVRAQAVEVAQNPASAGQEVSHMFESILQTHPTAAQLTQLVHRLRGGLSVAVLRKDLTAEARA